MKYQSRKKFGIEIGRFLRHLEPFFGSQDHFIERGRSQEEGGVEDPMVHASHGIFWIWRKIDRRRLFDLLDAKTGTEDRTVQYRHVEAVYGVVLHAGSGFPIHTEKVKTMPVRQAGSLLILKTKIIIL